MHAWSAGGDGEGPLRRRRRSGKAASLRSGREARDARARTHVAGGGGGGKQLRGFGIFNGSSGQPDQCVAANWLCYDVRRVYVLKNNNTVSVFFFDSFSFQYNVR